MWCFYSNYVLKLGTFSRWNQVFWMNVQFLVNFESGTVFLKQKLWLTYFVWFLGKTRLTNEAEIFTENKSSSCATLSAGFNIFRLRMNKLWIFYKNVTDFRDRANIGAKAKVLVWRIGGFAQNPLGRGFLTHNTCLWSVPCSLVVICAYYDDEHLLDDVMIICLIVPLLDWFVMSSPCHDSMVLYCCCIWLMHEFDDYLSWMTLWRYH